MQNRYESPEVIRQRRAVYHGLCAVLSEEEALSVLEMWADQAKSSQSVFSGLNMFVRDVCTKLGKTELQRELSQAINRALMAKPGDLRELPTGDEDGVPSEVSAPAMAPEPATMATSAAQAPAPSQSANSTPEFQTFQVLVLSLIDLVDQHSAATGLEFREYIKDVVLHLPWSEAQQEQLVTLVEAGSTVQTRAYRAGQLKTLLGHLKSWLVDNIGNAAATLAVDQAVAAAAKSPSGAEYAPKAFI
jgi:hypothetical protein